jgi:hypothetical protein
MRQRTFLRCALVLLAGMPLLTLAHAQPPDVSGPPLKRAELEKKAAALRRQISSSVKFTGFDDPATTVDDVLRYLERAYNVPFDVNTQAFKDEGVDDVLASQIRKELPAKSSVLLSTVLRKLMERIPVPNGSMYFVRGGTVEITTVNAYRAEFYPSRPNGPFAPLASASFENKPLNEALKQLAEDTDANILLDESRADQKARTPVTARLADVPLDTAVRLLADMAGLKMIEMDGVYYVTTKENAETLRKEQEKPRPAKATEPMPKTEPASNDK